LRFTQGNGSGEKGSPPTESEEFFISSGCSPHLEHMKFLRHGIGVLPFGVQVPRELEE